MGGQEDSSDEPSLQRIECNLSDVLLLVRNLAKRVQYLETQVGSEDSKRTVEWRKEIVTSLSRLLSQHDWKADKSDDYRRKRFAELGYENILQLAYMLPLETVLNFCQQSAPRKLPATLEPDPPPHAVPKRRRPANLLKGD